MYISNLSVLLSLSLLPLFNAQATVEPGKNFSSAGLTNYEAIQNTLNLDPIATDTRDWSLLSQIWTENATASYSANSTVVGIANIQTYLEAGTRGFTTQHLLATRLISVSDDGTTANSTQYLQATLWVDPLETPGQVGMLYGFYNDMLVKTEEGWRINDRVFRRLEPGLAGNTTALGGG